MAVTPARHFAASTTRRIERGLGNARETHDNYHRDDGRTVDREAIICAGAKKEVPEA
jgi:hypothetical protein